LDGVKLLMQVKITDLKPCRTSSSARYDARLHAFTGRLHPNILDLSWLILKAGDTADERFHLIVSSGPVLGSHISYYIYDWANLCGKERGGVGVLLVGL
jgi:hypothetical protein